jgi:hypothetical protein
MARLDADDEEALTQFATRCGCTLDQLRHAMQARSVNEMDIISFLSLRGYISQDVFLRMRNEIT